MLTLPHSGISLYFFAAEYRLADEIEAATGPTGRWQSGIDPLEEDGVDYALREVRARARLGGPWPSRCDAHAVYSKWSEMPANGQQKLEGEHALTCQWTPLIILVSDAPFSALRRFLDTCPEELELRRFLPGQHLLEIRTREETDMALSRILQSELIQQARIECEPPPMLDQN